MDVAGDSMGRPICEMDHQDRVMSHVFGALGFRFVQWTFHPAEGPPQGVREPAVRPRRRVSWPPCFSSEMGGVVASLDHQSALLRCCIGMMRWRGSTFSRRMSMIRYRDGMRSGPNQHFDGSINHNSSHAYSGIEGAINSSSAECATFGHSIAPISGRGTKH